MIRSLYLISVCIVLTPAAIIDPLTEQPIIDEAWINDAIVVPTTISILSRMIIVARTVRDQKGIYSQDYNYAYIRYPQSLGATLLQISNGISSLVLQSFSWCSFINESNANIHEAHLINKKQNFDETQQSNASKSGQGYRTFEQHMCIID